MLNDLTLATNAAVVGVVGHSAHHQQVPPGSLGLDTNNAHRGDTNNNGHGNATALANNNDPTSATATMTADAQVQANSDHLKDIELSKCSLISPCNFPRQKAFPIL